MSGCECKPDRAQPSRKRSNTMSKRNRSAKTGRFVSSSYTKKHPTTTVTETRNPYKQSEVTMKRKKIRQYRMLTRVVDFGAKHVGLFPEHTIAGEVLAEIGTTVTQLTEYATSR